MAILALLSVLALLPLVLQWPQCLDYRPRLDVRKCDPDTRGVGGRERCQRVVCSRRKRIVLILLFLWKIENLYNSRGKIHKCASTYPSSRFSGFCFMVSFHFINHTFLTRQEFWSNSQASIQFHHLQVFHYVSRKRFFKKPKTIITPKKFNSRKTIFMWIKHRIRSREFFLKQQQQKTISLIARPQARQLTFP